MTDAPRTSVVETSPEIRSVLDGLISSLDRFVWSEGRSWTNGIPTSYHGRLGGGDYLTADFRVDRSGHSDIETNPAAAALTTYDGCNLILDGEVLDESDMVRLRSAFDRVAELHRKSAVESIMQYLS